MNILMRLALSIDQGACLIITGQNDFTISGWAFIKRSEGKPVYSKIINKLFFWQKDHCKAAFMWEIRSAKALYTKHQALYLTTED
jgi:hypothetical protein